MDPEALAVVVLWVAYVAALNVYYVRLAVALLLEWWGAS